MKKLILALAMIFGLAGGLFAEPLEFVGKYKQGRYEVSYYESYSEKFYFMTLGDESQAEDFLDFLLLTSSYVSKPEYVDKSEYSIELQHFLENHEIVFLKTSTAYNVIEFYDENLISTIAFYFGE